MDVYQVNSKRPLIFFVFAATLTCAALLFFGNELHRADQQAELHKQRMFTLLEQADVLGDTVQRLPLDIEVAAETGNVAPIADRIERQQRLKEILASAANTLAGNAHQSMIQQVDSAFMTLTQHAETVEKLIKSEQREQAKAHIKSSAYAADLAVYIQLNGLLMAEVRVEAGNLLSIEDNRLKIDLYLMVVVILAVIASWIVVYQMSRKLNSRLEANNLLLNQKLSELETLNSELDLRVEERARELSIFRRFADAASNSLGMADMRNQSITYVNESLRKLLEEDEVEQIYQKSIQSYYTPESGQRLEQEMMPAVLSGESWSGELEMVTAKGNRRTTYESYFLVTDEQGNPLYLADVIFDISQRRELEDQLRQAKAMAEEAASAKGMFLANMSHEIRTPMNAIMGLTNLALDTELSPQQSDYLKKINLSAQSLLGIVNDVLDFSKIEAGKVDLETIPFGLQEDVLENVQNMTAFKIEEKELTLNVILPSELPSLLRGDPLRLGQVLLNLLNNAVKYTNKGSIKLEVKILNTDSDNVELKFEVTDTGIGLTKQQMSKLFQSFNQADASTTREFGGTGLGLAISAKLVELMGGEIGVESEYRKGSTFWFTTRTETIDPSSIASKQPYRIKSLVGSNVLVVDDNQEARDILTQYLNNFGCKVEIAINGEEAVSIIQHSNHSFDFILMDWRMPGIDGLEASRQIRELSEIHASTDILMVTAHDKDELLSNVSTQNISGVLVKPIAEQELLDTLLERFGSAAQNEYKRVSSIPEHVKGAHILLVEDNEINQQIADEVLTKQGILLDIVNNGAEGIAAVKQAYSNGVPYDAVLMDIQMPVMDGLTATRELRKDPRFAELPIIAMTANVLSDDKDRARDAGVTDHIFKPIVNHDMFSVIARWVEPSEDRADLSEPIASKVDAPANNSAALSIDGIETEWAIERCGGNKDFYLNILKRFCESNSDAETLLQALANNEETEELVAKAHSIRGTAANLGILEVQQAAEALESKLKQTKTVDQQLVETLGKAIRSAISTITAVLTNQPSSGGSQQIHSHAAIDTKELQALYSQLEKLLAAGDLSALEVLSKLEGREPENTEDREKLAAIAKYVEQYQFEEAFKLLQ
ncbi:response regulator [Agarivorans aestuarii]|uniref:histidine kinase n=1 Tax=Agarivorans aestuarii TaxID=1563703 RepID=A0ABU7G6I5_9ALTE|nr:response regulator [Agarivorans aestuarii]MEE1675027.1 response regulator [Agarivorans aestuarii]